MQTATVAPQCPGAHRALVTDVSMTNAGLGAAIRDVRHQRKMHQDHLAGVTGIDASVVSRIERGERPCRVAELVLLAAGLNISADELVRRAVQYPCADDAGSAA